MPVGESQGALVVSQNGDGNMNRIQRIVMTMVVLGIATGGNSVFAKSKQQRGNRSLDTNTIAAVTGQHTGKEHRTHHPHGVVTAVGKGSITIEKVKKHKQKTFKLPPNLTVEKPKNGKSHNNKYAPSTASPKHSKKSGKGKSSGVKVGDYVELTVVHKEVTKILDIGKKPKHSKHCPKNSGLTQAT